MDYRQEKTLDIFIRVIKMVIGIPTMLIMGLVALVGGVETLKKLYAFAEAGVYPVGAVMLETCLVGLFVAMTVGCARFSFKKVNEKIPPGLFLWLGVTFFVGGIGFSIIDTMEKDDWTYVNYPPYIEEWETQVVYKTVECDYSERVYFEGYFDYLTYGFRESENVEIVHDRGLTDRYRIEIKYKGLKSELNIYTDDYSGTPKENIYIYPIDYDYERTPRDYAYMYKHKVDFEYADPVAIEKITIRTAYPDMVDISGIR